MWRLQSLKSASLPLERTFASWYDVHQTVKLSLLTQAVITEQIASSCRHSILS